MSKLLIDQLLGNHRYMETLGWNNHIILCRYCHCINLDCCTLCRYCFDILIILIFNRINQTPVVVTVYALVQALHAHPNSELSLDVAEEYTCISCWASSERQGRVDKIPSSPPQIFCWFSLKWSIPYFIFALLISSPFRVVLFSSFTLWLKDSVPRRNSSTHKWKKSQTCFLTHQFSVSQNHNSDKNNVVKAYKYFSFLLII